MAEFWYLWLILAVLIIVTAVVIFFAARAASSHNKETKKLLKELERLKQLKDKYKVLTIELANEAEPFELLEGVNAVMQAEIEKADDAELTFSQFNDKKKNLYTLFYFLEDCEQGISFFFKNNGSELREQICPALENINAGELSSLVKSVYDMFDESNENASLDDSRLAEIDRQFLSTFDREKLLSKIKEYICADTDFLNS